MSVPVGDALAGDRAPDLWWELQWLLSVEGPEWSLVGVLVTTVVLACTVALLLAVLLDNLCVPRSGVQLFEQKRAQREIRRLILPSKAVTQVQRAEDGQAAGMPGFGENRWLRRLHWTAKMKRLGQAAKARLRAPPEWEHFQVEPNKLKDGRPVLVFVNSRSGGQQGEKVFRELSAYLHVLQIVDLQKEGPEAALEWWSKTELTYRILVCGGDGTVGWVLGVLEKLLEAQKALREEAPYVPPVAILPLGTGNDLARVTGWGGGYTGGSVLECLKQVDEAHVELLDRWAVTFRGEMPKKNAYRPTFLPVPKPEHKSYVMCNYFGLGVDAAVALDFHQMRERLPHLFFSRVVNKLWYMTSGATTLMENRCKLIGSKVKLECDGEEVQIGEEFEGVIVLNIPSFSGGTNLWGQDELEVDESEEDDSEEEADKSDASPLKAVSKAPDKRNALRGLRQSKQDKKLEVVGVHGILQLGAAQVGLYSATRLAQASRVKITTRADLPVEVDGEPSWFPRDGEIEIEFRSQAFMLAREPEGKHSVATDIVDWALQRNLINHSVRDELMQEIARRSQAVPRISTSQSAAHAFASG